MGQRMPGVEPSRGYWVAFGALLGAGVALLMIGSAVQTGWVVWLGLVSIGAAATWIIVADPS
jgi:hypothetical protein